MNTAKDAPQMAATVPLDGRNSPLHSQKGATLIEAMIAVAILTIGIITVMVMQTQAIRASSSSMNRTEANSVALTIMETFKELKFDDDNLDQTTATRAELAAVATKQQLQNLITAGKLATFTAAGFPELQEIISIPAGAVNGTVVDKSGVQYTLAWGILENMSSNGNAIGKTVWLLMYWDSLMGANKVQMTTLKYKNTPL